MFNSHTYRLVFGLVEEEFEREFVNIPNYSVYKTDLLRPTGNCPRCKHYSEVCLGHLGKYKLRWSHVNPLFAEEINSLCKLFCPKCIKPVSKIPNSTSAKSVVTYTKLTSIITDTCTCTGKHEKERSHKRLIVEKILQLRYPNEILKLFNLNTSQSLLVDYILLLPPETLKLLHKGDHVESAARKLLTERNQFVRRKEEKKALYDYWKALTGILTDKSGLPRGQILSTRTSRSARAVIVASDLPVHELGIPRLANKVLEQEHILTEDNIELFFELLCKGRVTEIRTNKKNYKVLDDKCLIQLSGLRRDSERGQVKKYYFTTLEDNDLLIITQKDVITKIRFGDVKTEKYYSLKRSLMKGGKLLRQDVTYIIPEGEQATYLLKCYSLSTLEIVHLTILPGLSFSFRTETGQLAVTRNPILSGDSLQVMFAKATSKVDLREFTPQEKLDYKILRRDFLQTPNGFSETQKLELVGSELRFLERSFQELVVRKASGVNQTISISTSLGKGRGSDVIELSPLAADPFHADYDGDEMNLQALPSKAHVSSRDTIANLVATDKVYFRGSYQYGLWCLASKVSIQSVICSDVLFARHIINSLRDKNPPPYERLGLSERQLRILSTYPKDRILTDQELQEILELLIVHHPETHILHGFDKLVRDFFCRLLTDEFRSTYYIRSPSGIPKNFNNKFHEIYSTYPIEEVERLYCKDSIIAKSLFFSEVGKALLNIASYYSPKFNPCSAEDMKELVDSGARPKKITLQENYYSIGKVSVPTTKGELSIKINKPYLAGLSEDETFLLSAGTRSDTISKVSTVGKTGEKLRTSSLFATSYGYKEGELTYKGQTILLTYDENKDRDSSERIYTEGTLPLTTVVTDKSPEKPYRNWTTIPDPIKERFRKIIHLGQLKLLLGEIDFLTKHYKGQKLVYIGAGPGTHIASLLDLFPGLDADLYDSTPFDSNLYSYTSSKLTSKGKLPRSKVRLFKQYFTVADCVLYRGEPTLLISDIRTKATDSGVAYDAAFHNELLTVMLPQAGSWKFRLPFQPGTTKLPEGEIHLQAWSKCSSTECRLYYKSPLRFKLYDNVIHQNKMYDYSLLRLRRTEYNILPELEKDLREADSLINNDAALTTYILENYCLWRKSYLTSLSLPEDSYCDPNVVYSYIKRQLQINYSKGKTKI